MLFVCWLLCRVRVGCFDYLFHLLDFDLHYFYYYGEIINNLTHVVPKDKIYVGDDVIMSQRDWFKQ